MSKTEIQNTENTPGNSADNLPQGERKRLIGSYNGKFNMFVDEKGKIFFEDCNGKRTPEEFTLFNFDKNRYFPK